jgi:hypothetical protein
MHDTARCLGYPSDSSRTARKRVRAAAHRPQARSISVCSFADAHRRHLRQRFGPLVRPAVSPPWPVRPSQAGRGLTPPSPARPPRAAGGAPASAGQAQPGGPGADPTVTCPAPPCGRRCARLGQLGPGGPGANSTVTCPPPPCGRRCWTHMTLPPGRHLRRPPGATGAVSRAYHSVRPMGRSAVCTGSPAADDYDGLGESFTMIYIYI